MSKKIIFYGGTQGIRKTDLLDEAIKLVKGSYPFETIPISSYFQESLKKDQNRSEIIWHQDDWKKYDLNVTEKLTQKIVGENKINIINNHYSVLYKGKYNYLPGLELTSLERLLLQSLCKEDKKGVLLPGIKPPCFGLLLIDLEPSLVIDYYLNHTDINKTDVLNYISEEMISRDLEQNRQWAKSYCDTAISVLGLDNVYRETIYVPAEYQKNMSYIYNRIAEFLKKFTNCTI